MCMLTAVLAAMLAFAMNVALAQEEFDLRWRTADRGGITLAIDTTLPDNAEIRISASRTYRATSDGKTDTYSHEYFREDGQVSQWRILRQVPTDDAVWVEELRAHMDEMAKLGTEMAFEIDNIDSHIEVTAYAYSHKSGERFGAPRIRITTSQDPRHGTCREKRNPCDTATAEFSRYPEAVHDGRRE